jgi:hypothetical protein
MELPEKFKKLIDDASLDCSKWEVTNFKENLSSKIIKGQPNQKYMCKFDLFSIELHFYQCKNPYRTAMFPDDYYTYDLLVGVGEEKPQSLRNIADRATLISKWIENIELSHHNLIMKKEDESFQKLLEIESLL